MFETFYVAIIQNPLRTHTSLPPPFPKHAPHPFTPPAHHTPSTLLASPVARASPRRKRFIRQGPDGKQPHGLDQVRQNETQTRSPPVSALHVQFVNLCGPCSPSARSPPSESSLGFILGYALFERRLYYHIVGPALLVRGAESVQSRHASDNPSYAYAGTTFRSISRSSCPHTPSLSRGPGPPTILG